VQNPAAWVKAPTESGVGVGWRLFFFSGRQLFPFLEGEYRMIRERGEGRGSREGVISGGSVVSG